MDDCCKKREWQENKRPMPILLSSLSKMCHALSSALVIMANEDSNIWRVLWMAGCGHWASLLCKNPLICYLRSQGPIHNMTQTRCYGRESRNLALKEEIIINVILMQSLKTAMWKGPGLRVQNENPQAGRNCFIFIFLELFFVLVLWCLDFKWSETSVDMPHLIISLAETCWL